MRIIKVAFLPKQSAPKNLKLKVYYVETDNFKIAEEKARDQLDEELTSLCEKFKVTKEELLHHYDKIVISEIKIIK